MTVIESRRLRPGDRVRDRDDLMLGTVEFCNWTHLRIRWDEGESPTRPIRHEAIASTLIKQLHV